MTQLRPMPRMPVSLLSLREISSLESGELSFLACGFVVSFASGYAALRMLLRIVKRGRFHVFAWYCWGLGILGVAGWFMR